jgi:hypothetical protein
VGGFCGISGCGASAMFHHFRRAGPGIATTGEQPRCAEPLSRGSDGFPDEPDFTSPRLCYNARMASKPKQAAKKKAKPGPKAETLNLEGDWKDNIRKSMQGTKPKG